MYVCNKAKCHRTTRYDCGWLIYYKIPMWVNVRPTLIHRASIYSSMSHPSTYITLQIYNFTVRII